MKGQHRSGRTLIEGLGWLTAAALSAALCGCSASDPSPAASQSNLEADTPATLLAFTTMFGVEGGFVKHNPIRGVLGDELPWDVGTATGSLTVDGHLELDVTGIVFADYPSVPPELVGTNDEAQFRGLVSCLVDDGHGRVSTVNLVTAGAPATPTGDASIDAFVELPDQCVAPIVFVMSGSEDLWFAVTGAETEESG